MSDSYILQEARLQLIDLYKKAMALPSPAGATGQKMKEQGIYIIQNMMSSLPGVTQKDIFKAIEQIKSTGASEFFSQMTPRTVISLPKIYLLDQNDVFELDGKKYVTVYVEDGSDWKVPGVAGKAYTAPSGKTYEKGQKIPGEVIALNLESGNTEVLDLSIIKDRITKPTKNVEAIAAAANKEIALYNERIGALSKALGASKLVLQIERANRHIDKRIEDLNGIIQSLQKQVDQMKGDPLAAFEQYAGDLKGAVQKGLMSLKDAYDTVLYLYASDPAKLISDLTSTPPVLVVPEEIKAGLLGIAKQHVEGLKHREIQEQKEKAEEKARIEQKEVPEIYDEPIQPFQPSDIPSGKQKYKEISMSTSLWTHIASLKKAIKGSQEDLQQLTQIKQSIDNMTKYMGDLEKGQRSKEFLNTPEGKPVLDAMNNFLSVSTLFIKRYATDIIQEHKVNPKLMGTAGTKGNALLAVALTRMYNVVKETIAMYTGGDEPGAGGAGAITEVPQVKEEVSPSPQVVATPETVAKTEDKIQKMSKLLWKAFEDRMRLR